MLPWFMLEMPSNAFIFIKISSGRFKIPIEFQNRLSKHINYLGHDCIMSGNSFWDLDIDRNPSFLIHPVNQIVTIRFEVVIGRLYSNRVLIYFDCSNIMQIISVCKTNGHFNGKKYIAVKCFHSVMHLIKCLKRI